MWGFQTFFSIHYYSLPISLFQSPFENGLFADACPEATLYKKGDIVHEFIFPKILLCRELITKAICIAFHDFYVELWMSLLEKNSGLYFRKMVYVAKCLELSKVGMKFLKTD